VGHRNVEVAAVTSTRLAGRRLDTVHPNLRGRTDLTFVAPDALDKYDVVFLAVAHRTAMRTVPGLLSRAGCLIDLSADFRLADPGLWQRVLRCRARGGRSAGQFHAGLAGTLPGGAARRGPDQRARLHGDGRHARAVPPSRRRDSSSRT